MALGAVCQISGAHRACSVRGCLSQIVLTEPSVTGQPSLAFCDQLGVNCTERREDRMTLPFDFPADRVAVIDDLGAELTFGDLDRRAKQFAQLIRAAGICAGGHIALCLENRLDYFWVLFGAHYAGVYYTAISPWLHADEIAYIAENCGAEMVIGTEKTREKMAQARANCAGVRRWMALDGGAENYEDLLAALSTMPAALPQNPREGRDMLYSSGSTGRPKGVLHALADTQFGEESDAAKAMYDTLGLGPDSVYLNPAPLYHAAPLRWSMSAIRRGGKVISMHRFDAERCLSLMSDHRVTQAQFVPTMMIRMLKLPGEVKAAADLSALRRVVHAAAPCPVETKLQIIKWWGPIVDEYYGGTEANGFTFVTAEEALQHPGTVGRALAGTIEIMDDDGQIKDPGEVGKIWWSGRPPFQYHGEPEKTADAHRGHRSTLGDIGYLDEDGYLYLTDRDVNLIVIGGTNVYPQLTEDHLAMHPDVGDVAVIGTPDEDMGEVILAVVEPSTDADKIGMEDRPRAHCASELPTIRQPKHYAFVETLPRHPNGKLRKVELRETYRRSRVS
ncbi:MAG: AMP-binding protein, partial [Pseudomonadota bacterium]